MTCFPFPPNIAHVMFMFMFPSQYICVNVTLVDLFTVLLVYLMM